MAKHSVPKRKQSKSYSGRRYQTFVNDTRKRLLNSVQLVPCSQCGEMRKVHHACTACGMYRGRQILDMQKKMSKITKIQA